MGSSGKACSPGPFVSRPQFLLDSENSSVHGSLGLCHCHPPHPRAHRSSTSLSPRHPAQTTTNSPRRKSRTSLRPWTWLLPTACQGGPALGCKWFCNTWPGPAPSHPSLKQPKTPGPRALRCPPQGCSEGKSILALTLTEAPYSGNCLCFPPSS